MNQQIRTQPQSNHHQPESSQQHPNEPTYVSNQYRWQSNVNSLYQGLNQREDEDQTMRQSNVKSQ
jgi:hypothetical protein